MKEANSITSSIFYKSLERYSTMAFQLIVQIVIARILNPEDFGVVAMMAVFINVAGVFIYNGFNMAVIQKKEADDKDFSTALIVNFFIGCFLYAVIFVCSSAIANYYNQPELKISLQVLALILPLGSVYSIQSAIASRFMYFDILFVCNFVGSVASGILGVGAALSGLGFWALIIQQLSNIVVATLLLSYKIKWRPQFMFVWNSAKEMFHFGWKLLMAGLLNSIYNELNSLVIGKKYSSSDLAFYTKGKTFPSAISSGLDSALQSVMLSAFSKKQSDINSLKELMKKSIVSNTYIITPTMILLAICASPLTEFLLTKKWLHMVPFMQICCFTFSFHPIDSIIMQALASIGRSDIRLKLELLKKPIGLVLLLFSMNYGPIAIALSAALTSLLALLTALIASRIIIGFPIKSFVQAVFPSWFLALPISLPVYAVNFLNLPPVITMILQLLMFISLYLLLSHKLKLKGYLIVKDKFEKVFKKNK